MSDDQRITRRRLQMAECRRLLGVSERLTAAAIVSIPLLVAASIMMNRAAILWVWLPLVLFIAAVLFRNFGDDALHKAQSHRRGSQQTINGDKGDRQ